MQMLLGHKNDPSKSFQPIVWRQNLGEKKRKKLSQIKNGGFDVIGQIVLVFANFSIMLDFLSFGSPPLDAAFRIVFSPL